MKQRLKFWTGSLDGKTESLIVASSIKRAAELAKTTRYQIDTYMFDDEVSPRYPAEALSQEGHWIRAYGTEWRRIA